MAKSRVDARAGATCTARRCAAVIVETRSIVRRQRRRLHGARMRWSSADPVAGEQQQIRGEDRGAHVGVKRRGAFPHASRETEDAFQERDAALDPGAEAAQLVVHPVAPHHGEDGERALLRKADVLDPERFAVHQVVVRGEAAVKTDLARRPAEESLLAAAGGARGTPPT